MLILRNRITVFIVAMMTVLALILIPSPADAHHAGPFVWNGVAGNIDVLVRDHTWGTKAWEYVGERQYSRRGAEGLFIPPNGKVYYESYTSGWHYWSQCGEYYRARGYEWRQKPFMPMNPDRSILVRDVVWNYPGC